MLITIHAVDGNGLPLKNAVLTFSKNGSVFNTLAFPANTGILYFDSVQDADLFTDEIDVRATATGYQTAGNTGGVIANYTDYTFTMPANHLQNALLAGAGIGAALFVLLKNKKKVSGFSDLSPVAKNALVLGGVGVAAWLIFKNLLGTGQGSGTALVTAAAAQLNSLTSSGNGPTISPLQAEGYASSLRTAFDDCGTDTATVDAVFAAMNNTADVLLLTSTYGTRGYKGCFDGDYFGNHNYNLSEALTSELSASELQQLNANLSYKGIDYKF